MDRIRIVGAGLLLLLGGCSGADGAMEGTADAPSPPAAVDEAAEAPAAPAFAATEAEFSALTERNRELGVIALVVGPGTELLATIDLPDDGQVNLLRDADGLLVAHQTQRGTAKPALTRADMSQGPLETFQRLAPERAAPQALLDAQFEYEQRLAERPRVTDAERIQRREALLPTSNPTIVENGADDSARFETSGEIGQLRQAAIDDSKCPAEDFNAAHCESADKCLLFRTNDSKVARSDEHHVMSSACSYRGNIIHRMDIRHWSDWKILGRATLKPGWNDAFYLYADGWPTDFDFEAIIQEAAGDGYHHAVWW